METARLDTVAFFTDLRFDQMQNYFNRLMGYRRNIYFRPISRNEPAHQMQYAIDRWDYENK